VALLDEAVRYKPEFRVFNSRSGYSKLHGLNPSGHTVALGWTQPVTEMSTRDILRVKGGRYVGLTSLPPSCADGQGILGASCSWNPKGLSRPVMG
jgi:hypothetical protein